MPDPIVEHCGKAVISVPKEVIEREAREAYAAGRTPNDACRYPFSSHCAMHWLAIYNLCMPLPRHVKTQDALPR